MYRIKNDKRTQKSAAKIVEAFVSCLHEKDFESITVSDIAEKAEVSRSTFYRIFDNVIDIVEYKADYDFADAVQRFTKTTTNNNIIRFVLEVCFEKADTLQMILACNKPRLMVSILDKAMSNCKQAFTDYYGDNNEQYKYTSAILVGIAMSVIAVWHREGQKDNIDELIKRIEIFNNDVTKNNWI